MRATIQTWKRVAIGFGFVVLALGVMHAWSKQDFCQGWANHYAARAEEFRSEAANPAVGRDDARKYLVAADTHELIARKYAAVASRPWRPYPGYPLITPGEQRIIEARH